MRTSIIEEIEDDIAGAFGNLYTWFYTGSELIKYRPKNGGWSIGQNLEHVYLTNHFLLILIRKGAQRSLQLANKEGLKGLPNGYVIDREKLDAIGTHRSFKWMHPAHMEPEGVLSLVDINGRLRQQQAECNGYLLMLGNGEGILYKTMMSVNNIGKLDVYHYIGFLVQHIKRHLQQMEKITLEFDQL